MPHGRSVSRWRSFHRKRKAGEFLLPYIAVLATAELVLMLVSHR